jgi:hypothetical protein
MSNHISSTILAVHDKLVVHEFVEDINHPLRRKMEKESCGRNKYHNIQKFVKNFS